MKDEWGAFCSDSVTLEATGKGVLAGMGFALKDVFALEGYVPGAGNPDWKRTHSPEEKTAHLVQALLAEGAHLVGTTHTDELMYSLNGENYHYGTPINPRAPKRIPGGSSSGSAVAVAGGLAAFAVGTDTGGSVRIPASYCGIYGYRPTHGAMDTDGLIPLAPSFDTVGLLAHDPRTLLLVAQVLLGDAQAGEHVSTEGEHNLSDSPAFPSASPIESSGADSTLRFGLNGQGLPGSGQYFGRAVIGLDALELAFPEVQDTLFALMQKLAARLTFVDRHNIAAEGLEVWAQCFRRLQGREIWRSHGDWITREQPRFGPDVAARFAWAAGLVKGLEDAGADESAESGFSDMSDLEMRMMIGRRMRNMLGEDTVLLIPTAPGPAPLRGTLGRDMEEWRTRTMQLTCIAGLAGLPQLSLPVIGPDRLPIGLSAIAGAGQDIKLLRWVTEVVEAGLVDAGLVPSEEATVNE